MLTNRKWLVTLLLLVLLPLQAHADIVVTVTPKEDASPVAVVPFGWTGKGAGPRYNVGQIIAADLARSGYFRTLPPDQMLRKPTSGSEVDFRDWRALNQSNLVVGQLQPLGPGKYRIRFQLYDVFRGELIDGGTLATTDRDLRSAAHQISDLIFETLTGIPGAFDTRIAYITAKRRPGVPETLTLWIADSDGFNAQDIVTSKDPLMSPAWSPDGSKLAYVSFEGRSNSSIWVQEVFTGKRQRMTSFPGINGAPAWSPDGRYLALTLSKDGNPDIYIMDIARRSLRRLTNHFGIDTEPAWSPDGRHLVFTSDRGGNPQIYRVPVGGGKPERVTFEGKYNARASYSPRGDSLTVVTRMGGDYRIGVLDLQNKALRVLSTGKLDESPSFAPNGSMIIYATRAKGRGVLSAVSADGSVKQTLREQAGDVREPVWSPYYQRERSR